jgi:preprotein translocase subunit SecG
MLLAIEISLIIVSVALIASVVLQSKGAGLGGLTGQESGGVYTARRGIERTLFWVTMALSILFFLLAFIAIIISA